MINYVLFKNAYFEILHYDNLDYTVNNTFDLKRNMETIDSSNNFQSSLGNMNRSCRFFWWQFYYFFISLNLSMTVYVYEKHVWEAYMYHHAFI